MDQKKQMVLVSEFGRQFILPDQSEVLVGRIDNLEKVFPDVDLTDIGAEEGGVSRRHALIRFADNNYTLEDLGSVNGTFLNRQQLKPKEVKPLKAGDQIRLGRLSLIFSKK